MKKTTLLLMAMTAMLLTSCSSIRYCSDDLKATPRTDIPVLEPYTSIKYLTTMRKSDESIPMSDSLTNCAYAEMVQTLRNDSQLPVGDMIYVDNDTVRDLIDYAMSRIAWGIPNKKVASQIKLPDVLQQYMEDNDLPYLMLIFHQGFDSSTGKLFAEAGKSLGLAVVTAVATLGTISVFPLPISVCCSYMTLLVADRDRGTLAYYDRVGSSDRPASPSTLNRQMKQLLKHYPEE